MTDFEIIYLVLMVISIIAAVIMAKKITAPSLKSWRLFFTT